MHNIVSKLLIYGDMPKDSILMELSSIIREFKGENYKKDEIITRIYHQVKRILEVSTDYGFDRNLWHNYLTYLLITNENPFSLTCEKVGANDGSVNYFAKNDFKQFMKLFDYDFKPMEEELGIDCFERLQNYKAIGKTELMYNKNVSEKVQSLSLKLENAKDENEFFDYVTEFYKQYGVGMFGLNKAFRIKDGDGPLEFHAINNMDKVVLDDLVGYEIQKKKLVDNTEAFVQGRKANNCLLFGDSGTGKSTSIKAIVNEYYEQGLRMIEIYKHQFKDLSNVIAAIKNRNYKFIIYMDDLSFEDFEIEYKFLKAVIEGGVETKPENILIYATSNRRHLIKETWNDRSDVQVENGMHKSDTMEEKLSLVHRFGVTINYSKPTQKEYFEIAVELCRRLGVKLSDDEIKAEANKWELSHGGISGRTAQQFANYLAGQQL
ncbi:ATP-binding protein [Eubacterium sp. AF15-50]|uniref:ATP-binding protein n=1 Tax=unclassified Eubacterium (in: firmicutes) TaxID=2624479 RepID=UPI000E4B0DCF|nr:MULTISPECIES: ATP-binding protein [unclassified Eubacterium (in: firmicutes)]RHR72244.1 ATP-binding protein [Eubacterium sp. AF16-48]RHR79973.1 ATP-binding protein [Eubacterium sp. AF15-50]